MGMMATSFHPSTYEQKQVGSVNLRLAWSIGQTRILNSETISQNKRQQQKIKISRVW